MDEEHRNGTLDFITRRQLVYVCVDEPQGFPDTLPPVAASTADVAEVRFRGRNSRTWAVRDASPRRRYAHDYRAERTRRMGTEDRRAALRGKAVACADEQLLARLRGP
jgi:uncharacterized protein YecE (DUF72 family)